MRIAQLQFIWTSCLIYSHLIKPKLSIKLLKNLNNVETGSGGGDCIILNEMHLLDKSRGFHWNRCECSMGDSVVYSRFSEAVIFGPHPLEMKINRGKFESLAGFVHTLTEIHTWKLYTYKCEKKCQFWLKNLFLWVKIGSSSWNFLS